MRCRELDIFKVLNFFENCLEFFWKFFWEFFWRIFWEEFFGTIFLGGFFQEDFFFWKNRYLADSVNLLSLYILPKTQRHSESGRSLLTSSFSMVLLVRKYPTRVLPKIVILYSTVAINDLLCMKNVGAQIKMDFS